MKVNYKKDRKSFSEVCKQWYKVEALSPSSLSVNINISYVNLSGALTRFPNLVNLEIWCPKNDTDLELIAQGCQSLLASGNGCPKLSQVKLSGRGVIGDSGVAALIHSAHNLKDLVLVYTWSISDEALRAIASSTVRLLHLERCKSITDVGLGFLANGSTSKTLEELMLFKYVRITDTGVELLRRICSLECLEISCCEDRITDIGGVAVSTIQTLKELHLFWLTGVTDATIVALAENCRNLEILDLHRCVQVTGAGIRAFSGKRLALYGLEFLSFNLADVETLALGFPSLESVLVHTEWSLERTWSSELMHENTRKVIKFVHLPFMFCKYGDRFQKSFVRI